MSQIGVAPAKVLPRNTLSARQLAEFRRTARLVADSAWQLGRAEKYLSDLCADNEAGREHRPPSLVYFTTHADEIQTKRTQRERAGPPEELLTFAPGTPRRVVASFQDLDAEGAGQARTRNRGRGRGRGRGRLRDAAPVEPADAEEAPAEAEEAPADDPLPRHPAEQANGGAAGRGAARPNAQAAKAAPKAVQAKRILKRPAAASEPEGPGPSVARKAFRQQSVDEQGDKLGCSKCKHKSHGCARCKQLRAIWREQNGMS